MDKPADFGTGLSLRLTKIDSVNGKATVPGEIAGPAIKVTLQARNSSSKAIGLNRVIVFVSYGKDRTPASELSEGAKPFRGNVAPGQRLDGVYLFSVPKDQRDNVRIEVSYSGQEPTVAFEGAIK